MSKEELEVVVATAKLEAAQAEADRARKDWERAQQLLQFGPGHAISASDAEQAECDYKVAQAGVRGAAAELEIANLALPKQG
jgi:multidrug resistance efflux pump